MTRVERINKIDKAIDDILSNLQSGFEITEYTIGSTTIKKRSPIELVNELMALRNKLKNTQKSVSYVF